MSLLILLPTGNTSDNNKLTLPSDFVTMDTEGGSLRQHDGETKGGFIHQAVFPLPPFIGEVPVEELISGDVLASLVGLTAGTAFNNNEPWLHFVDPTDNKTKFISKKPYRYDLTWDQIDEVGLSYGKEITIDGKQYICRLIKGCSSDPYAGSNGYDTEGTWNSEWNRLMYPICAPTGNAAWDIVNDPSSPGLGAWAQYDQENDLYLLTHNGRYTWCQETAPNINQRIRRAGSGVCRLTIGNSYIATPDFSWRPLLELIE